MTRSRARLSTQVFATDPRDRLHNQYFPPPRSCNSRGEFLLSSRGGSILDADFPGGGQYPTPDHIKSTPSSFRSQTAAQGDSTRDQPRPNFCSMIAYSESTSYPGTHIFLCWTRHDGPMRIIPTALAIAGVGTRTPPKCLRRATNKTSLPRGELRRTRMRTMAWTRFSHGGTDAGEEHRRQVTERPLCRTHVHAVPTTYQFVYKHGNAPSMMKCIGRRVRNPILQRTFS